MVIQDRVGFGHPEQGGVWSSRREEPSEWNDAKLLG